MAIAEAKRKIDLLQYIKQNSPVKARRVNETEYRLKPCPICGHNDCCTVYTNQDTYYCYSGDHDSGGSIVDFVKEYKDMNLKEAMDLVEEIAGTKHYKPNCSNDSKNLNVVQGGKKEKERPKDFDRVDYFYKNVSATNYYTRRGIGKELIDKYRLGYDPDYNAAILPVCNKSGEIIFITKRLISSKANKYHNVGSSQIFNDKLLQSDQKVIFVTEGIFDALSIESVIGDEAMALNSTSNINDFLMKCRNLESLNDKYFVFLLDDDQAGDKAAKKVKDTGLDNLIVEKLKDSNDANDFLQNGKAEELKVELVEIKNSLLYSDTNYAFLNNFIDTVKENKGTTIQTGFNQFDNILNGGLYPGLYVIGAISSLGKTTFCLQLADQIAKNGQDNIFISMEQSNYELLCKSIVRTAYKSYSSKSVYLTVTDLLSGKIDGTKLEYIEKGLSLYRESAKHIRIVEDTKTVEDISKCCHSIIENNNIKPTIIVDYLQIIQPSDSNNGYRQTVDYNLSELKKLSRQYDIPVIVISSFNRNNYTNLVSFSSFKESGTIEYSADVVLGMQLAQMSVVKSAERTAENVNKWKAEMPRKIELVVLKQRNGPAFGKVHFSYNPLANNFEEVNNY